jgi:hypothetical protein
MTDGTSMQTQPHAPNAFSRWPVHSLENDSDATAQWLALLAAGHADLSRR